MSTELPYADSFNKLLTPQMIDFNKYFVHDALMLMYMRLIRGFVWTFKITTGLNPRVKANKKRNI